MWAAVWVVLCVAGLAATAGLNASSAPEAPSGKPVSAECAKYIADIERKLAKAEEEGEGDGVLGFSRMRVGTEDDCGEEFRNHFGGDR